MKFNNNAQIIKLLNKELPPYDINGNATPTTGKIPTVIDIFIRNSKKILKESTNKIILLKTCVSLYVLKTGIKNKTKKSEINNIDPVKPNCSEKIAKTKSVSFSGRKSKLLWEPSRKPLPLSPPEPIAILD